jgi:glutathione S-transferase
MSVKLYYAPGACSFVPHVALEAIAAATGEPFEYQSIRLHKGEQASAEYLAMNPDGQVPVLTVDGRPLTQILAICEYLDARYPKVGLLPADPWARAQAMSSLAWMNNTVHTTFANFFMPQKFTADATAQASVRAFAVPKYRAHLERIQGWLECAQPWLGGAAPSFVDAYALTLLRWGGFAGIDPASLPAYRAYVERLAQQPTVAAAMAREKLELNTYKPAAA